LKAVLVILFLLASSNAVAQISEIDLKIGTDLLGNKDDYKVRSGFEANVALLRQFPRHDWLMFGIGAEYQHPRAHEVREPTFFFLPVYGIVRARVDTHENFTDFIIAQAGYAFYHGEGPNRNVRSESAPMHYYRGGPHVAFGVNRIIRHNVLLEALFSIDMGCNRWMSPYERHTSFITYRKVNLSLGYAFR
jgi:hypothetical protein